MSTATAANPWGVTATNSGGNNDELPPAENNPAVLVGLIDLGTHDEEYQGKHYQARKALLCWELTADHKSDGSPFIVTRDYSISEKLSKKSGLRVMLESWRSEPLNDKESINLLGLLGKPCLVNIIHSESARGNKYAKITGISKVPKGTTVPKPLCQPFEWHIGSGDFQAPDWLPYLYGEPVEDVIKRSHELGGARRVGPGPAVPSGPGDPNPGVPVGAGVGAADDDIPF
jgi:hypothetical protein